MPPYGNSDIGIYYNDNTLVSGTENTDFIYNSKLKSTIKSGFGNDTIINDGAGCLIQSGIGDDYIVDDSGSTDTIEAGKGNDTIDLIWPNEKRIIKYSNGDGNDIILGYFGGASSFKDTIQIADDNTYSTMESDNDIVIYVGDGSMTLKEAKAKSATLEISGGTYDSTSTDPTVPGDPTDPTVPNGEDKTVKLTNDTISPYTADSDVVTIDGSARTKAINITANANNNVIIGGKGKDTLTGGAGNDTFVTSAGKDIINDYAEVDVVSLSGALTKTAISKNNVVLTIDKVTTTLKDTKGKKISIIDKNGNLSKQTFGVKSISIADGDGNAIDIALNTTAITIDSSSRTTVLDLTGNAKANYFKTGTANETITSGKGKDTIEYNGGNDVINDYTAGQDKLKLSVDLTNTILKDNDVVLSTNNGTITLKEAKGKKVTTIDKDGNTTSMIYGSSSTTLNNADGDSFKAFGDTVVLDASNRSKPTMLIGNDANNTIIGGKNGKKKFDTLTGGAGADTFVYTNGYGNDIITDYSAFEGDIIQLGKKTSISKAQIVGDDYIFTIGSGKLTMVGGANKYITFVDDDDNELIYKKHRSTENIGFEERWFIEGDNNYNVLNDSSDMDSILKINSDLTKEDYKLEDITNITKDNKYTQISYNDIKNK